MAVLLQVAGDVPPFNERQIDQCFLIKWHCGAEMFIKQAIGDRVWGDSLTLSSIPSFHDLRLKISYRRFAVLLAYILQHGTCGLRTTATESVIELVDALSMWAVMADEDHAARVFVDSCT